MFRAPCIAPLVHRRLRRDIDQKGSPAAENLEATSPTLNIGTLSVTCMTDLGPGVLGCVSKENSTVLLRSRKWALEFSVPANSISQMIRGVGV